MQKSALCRSRRELSNAYLLAKFGFDTDENEPCKVCLIEQCRPDSSRGPLERQVARVDTSNGKGQLLDQGQRRLLLERGRKTIREYRALGIVRDVGGVLLLGHEFLQMAGRIRLSLISTRCSLSASSRRSLSTAALYFFFAAFSHRRGQAVTRR